MVLVKVKWRKQNRLVVALYQYFALFVSSFLESISNCFAVRKLAKSNFPLVIAPTGTTSIKMITTKCGDIFVE